MEGDNEQDHQGLASARMLLAAPGAGFAETPKSRDGEGQKKSCRIPDCEAEAHDDLGLCPQTRLPSSCTLIHLEDRKKRMRNRTWGRGSGGVRSAGSEPDGAVPGITREPGDSLCAPAYWFCCSASSCVERLPRAQYPS